MKTRSLFQSFPLSPLVLGLVATLLGGVNLARANAVYTSPTDFAKSVGADYLETFNSLAAGVHLASPLPFAKNGFSYTASAPGGFDNTTAGAGSSDVYLSTYVQAVPITFTMTSSNVTAVGGDFFLTNVLGNVRSGDVTIALSNGTTDTFSPAIGSAFLGFTSSVPITSLTVTPDAGGTGFATVNDFVVGTAVPDSGSTLLLLGAGLASLGVARGVLRGGAAIRI